MKNSKDLHKKFKTLGAQKFKLTNQLLAILPEIYEKRIYKKYASSIFEYAAKFGGLSNTAVTKRLRLEKHLKDKPKLREAIKEVGVNKVAMVATLVTPETEKAFVDKVRNMSFSAVQTLSKELRQKEAENRNDLVENDFCQAVPQTIKLELDAEMTFLFLKLKQKWGKHMSNKQIMAKIMAIVTEKEFPKHPFQAENINSSTTKSVKKSVSADNSTVGKKDGEINDMPTAQAKKQTTKQTTRYVTAQEKSEAFAPKPNKKAHQCHYPNCNKPAEVLHHKHRFSESKSHESITPLCKTHHEFMHNGLIPNENNKNWKLSIDNKTKTSADILYRKYRQEALVFDK